MSARPLAPLEALLEDLHRATDRDLRAVWVHLERLADDAERDGWASAAALLRCIVVVIMAEGYDREAIAEQVNDALRHVDTEGPHA